MSEKQTIVLTGGSAGIGKSICERLLNEGYAVVNLSRRAAPFEHVDLHNIELDLSDRAAVQGAADLIVSDFNVTGFVHNAGLIRANLLEDVALEDLDYLTQVHLGSAIALTQALLPNMIGKGKDVSL